MDLPTKELNPEREFKRQKFVHNKADKSKWTDFRIPGFTCRDTTIAFNTNNVAGVQVVKPNGEGDNFQVVDRAYPDPGIIINSNFMICTCDCRVCTKSLCLDSAALQLCECLSLETTCCSQNPDTVFRSSIPLEPMTCLSRGRNFACISRSRFSSSSPA